MIVDPTLNNIMLLFFTHFKRIYLSKSDPSAKNFISATTSKSVDYLEVMNNSPNLTTPARGSTPRF